MVDQILVKVLQPTIANKVGGAGTLVTPYLTIAAFAVARTANPVRATELFAVD
jgi:hypothetical protein